MIHALLLSLALQDPRVVEGFTIEKVADASFPMFACFDDRGRLYVTESSGGDLYLELQKLTRGCKVRRFDADFKASTVFAENLTPSMGLAWRDGKLYVADPPDLAVLEDTDGDGKADRRTVLLTGFGHQDNGSLHGLVFGPEGNLYFTMGDPDGFKLRGPDGSTAEGRTGGLLRCRPDGSRLEILCLGFENLVEVVFLPGGEILGTDNWFQLPTGGIRDALVHLLPGGVYPRHHETKHLPLVRTGDALPAASLFPAVALSGLVRYSGSSFPDLYGHLFSAQHNARKVQRHALQSSGHTFATTDYEFVWSDNPDFHPSDVLQAPDGSLLVVDTGAWYVQHCPTGKIRNSRAPGGLWRVTSKHGRPPEVGRAIDEMERGWASKWKLASAPGETALNDLIGLLETADGRFAAHALALRGDRAAGPALVRQLSRSGATFRLAAAVALASCGTPEALPSLWEALEGPIDAHLEHAIVYAVHRIADRPALEKAVDHPNPRVQKAALLLLDQRGGASKESVLHRVGSGDPGLRRTAIQILQKHKEWAPSAIGLVRDWLRKGALAEDERQALRGSILAFQGDADVQSAVAEALRGRGPLSEFLLAALAETSLPKFPTAWKEALRTALPSAEAVRTIAVLGLSDFDDLLSDIAQMEGPARLAAIRAVVSRRPTLPAATVDFLVATMGAESPLDRLTASETLARGHLTRLQAAQAVRAVRGNALLSPSLFLPALREPADAALLA
ncbi:MAG TPA: PVC-type heme-binding CxxCH protein, partial [Planctomycetota bacterium]|nr:PVC-type heme-binding CxxCH protein [Planctomycetota bacterium]